MIPTPGPALSAAASTSLADAALHAARDLARAFADDPFARLWSPGRRGLRLRLPGELGAVFDGLLLPQRVVVREGFDTGLRCHLTCLASRADLPLAELVGLPAEIGFVTDLGALRTVCAIVTSVQQGQSDGALTTIRLVADDFLRVLDLGRRSRVHREQGVLELVRAVVDEQRKEHPAFARCVAPVAVVGVDAAAHAERRCTVQFNESDAALLRRVLAAGGLSFFIRPAADGEGDTPAQQLVVVQDLAALPENAAGTLRYHRRDGTEPRDSIDLLGPLHRLVPGAVESASFDHRSARVDRIVETGRAERGRAAHDFAAALRDARIDLPHLGDSADHHQFLLRRRMQHHEGRAQAVRGEGGVAAQRVGEYNRIDGHAGLDAGPAPAREYVTVAQECWAQNNLPKTLRERVQRLLDAAAPDESARPAWARPDGDDAETAHRFTNRFVLARRDRPLAPALPELPAPPLLTGVVLGAEGRPIACDDLGRVQVRIAGMEPGRDATAWVRTNVPWAGDGFGLHFPLRPGMEVSLGFEMGDPSRPLILGCRHNAAAPPPRFDHLGALPANAALGGIVSRELGGAARQQQLRFDDTGGRIGVQLASDHAASQLNLGSLRAPMHDGVAAPRGQGAELRTDASLALRGGRGVQITSHARPGAEGEQLDRQELLGLAEALQAVSAQMAELATAHAAGQNDAEPLARAQRHLRDWHHGGPTAPDAPGGGAPLLALASAAGATLAAQDNLLLGAQTTLDAVAIGQLQATAGQQLLLRSGALMAAFSQAAMKLVARLDVQVESHAANVSITAAKVIDLVAGEKVRIHAPEIEIVAQGTATRWGGGRMEAQARGEVAVRCAAFRQTSGGDGAPRGVEASGRKPAFDQQVQLIDDVTGERVSTRKYRIRTETGRVIDGTTDHDGWTERFTVDDPYEVYRVDTPND